MAALEIAVRIPAGQESDAARELAARTPAAMTASLRAFAAALVGQLETAEHSVLVLDLPQAEVERLAAGIAPGTRVPVGR